MTYKGGDGVGGEIVPTSLKKLFSKDQALLELMENLWTVPSAWYYQQSVLTMLYYQFDQSDSQAL